MPDTTPTTDLAGRLRATLTERYTSLGNPFSEMRYNERGPDGWPASHPVSPDMVATLLRELLADDPARQVLGTTDQQPTPPPTGPCDEHGACHTADWTPRSTDKAAAAPAGTELRDRLTRALDECRTMIPAAQADVVLSVLRKAGVLPAPTDRAAELAEFRAQIANFRTMYNAADARTSDLIDERDALRAEVERLRTEHATWRKLGTRNLKAAHEEIARLRGVVERLRTDRATVLREGAEVAVRAARGCGGSETGQYAASVAAGIGRELRRMADEAQQCEEHACDNCDGIDPDTCVNNPHRPPEQCPAAEFEDYGQQCQKPVGHELHTYEEQPAPAEAQQPETEADDSCTCISPPEVDDSGVVLHHSYCLATPAPTEEAK